MPRRPDASRARPSASPVVVTAALIGALAGAGCSLTGPSSIRDSRSSYNAAIATTTAEQLLLNLVRLRYRDVPLFLEVSSVTTSFEIEAQGQASGAWSAPDFDGFGLSGRLTLSERPTVTYLPLQGEKFVQKLMKPLETEILALMYHSGWSLDRILKVCVQRLGPLVNAPRASGPTPKFAPEYEAFYEAAALLQALWERGDVELGISMSTPREGAPKGAGSGVATALVIRFDDEAKDSAEVERLKTLLGLPAGVEMQGLTASQTEISGDAVLLTTRSLMACLFFLSQGVDPPDADRDAGRVTQTVDATGKPFDWATLTNGLMLVSSGSKPEGAYVTVEYRGSWFWIADADLESKTTFALLSQLLELQSGGVENIRPVLTLPIGG